MSHVWVVEAKCIGYVDWYPCGESFQTRIEARQGLERQKRLATSDWRFRVRKYVRAEP